MNYLIRKEKLIAASITFPQALPLSQCSWFDMNTHSSLPFVDGNATGSTNSTRSAPSLVIVSIRRLLPWYRFSWIKPKFSWCFIHLISSLLTSSECSSNGRQCSWIDQKSLDSSPRCIKHSGSKRKLFTQHSIDFICRGFIHAHFTRPL